MSVANAEGNNTDNQLCLNQSDLSISHESIITNIASSILKICKVSTEYLSLEFSYLLQGPCIYTENSIGNEFQSFNTQSQIQRNALNSGIN